jgi:phosphopantetheine adenylyltransferase
MRAVAIEEEVDVDRFGSVLAFMERLQVLDSAEHWKLIRELRNAVNHDYEENVTKLNTLLGQLLVETATLFQLHHRLRAHCSQAYRLQLP